MSKNVKIITGILGFIVLAAGIFAGTYLVQKNQDIREKAAPATSLSFTPATVNKNPGQTFNLTINANSGENKITGIDIEVTFDPSVIQLTGMSGTSAIAPLTTVIKNGEIDNTLGKARFVAFTAVKADAISGDLGILNLTGNILSTATAGQYPIAFSATTTISAADEGTNVVINSTPSIITVTSGSSGATASPSPTGSSQQSNPTATPSPTNANVGGAQFNLPTATPTVAPTAKATATTKPNTTTAPTNSGSQTQATLPPDVPVTGISLPFAGSIALGVIALMFSLFLVF